MTDKPESYNSLIVSNINLRAKITALTEVNRKTEEHYKLLVSTLEAVVGSQRERIAELGGPGRPRRIAVHQVTRCGCPYGVSRRSPRHRPHRLLRMVDHWLGLRGRVHDAGCLGWLVRSLPAAHRKGRRTLAPRRPG
jgi:hypothetical protein